MNLEILISILSIPSQSGDCQQMADFLTDYCNNKGYDFYLKDGNLYITKGNSNTYPCVVAHLDTVHNIEKGGIQPIQIGDLITGVNPLTMKQTGIGGDDKCGIYAALYCLEALPYCKAAFFIDEEVGCIGSRDANIQFFKDCRFVLQADRRGNSDFVTDINGPLSSKRFKKDIKQIIKSYGFSFCNGLMTDVEALRDIGVGISVANISAGYYRPHCKDEYISITDLYNTAKMMADICLSMTGVYKFTPPLDIYYCDNIIEERFLTEYGKEEHFLGADDSLDWDESFWTSPHPH